MHSLAVFILSKMRSTSSYFLSSIVLLDSLRSFPVIFSNMILSQNCFFLLSFKKVQNHLRAGGWEGSCGCVEPFEKKKLCFINIRILEEIKSWESGYL